MGVNIGKNGLKNILILVLTLLLLFVIMVGTTSAADQQAGGGTAASGFNVTLNSTSATGITAALNTTTGASITVSFNNTNATANWFINASNNAVSINGSGTPNGNISSNGTFTLNSTTLTDFFSVNVTNADNSSENTTLTGFRFVNPTAIVSTSNMTISYNNGTTSTSVLTSNYYFYNNSYINITISTIAKMDNVTVNYTNVSGGIGYNITGANISGTWYYNITNVTAPSAADASVNQLYANLSFNGVNYTVNVPFIALMNFNPTSIDTTLGGETTDWTSISDFTNVTNLVFEKFVSGNSVGLLTFTGAMNLTNQTTASALANLGTNLVLAQHTMNLNTAADALSAMNVSANLSFKNLSFSSLPAIFKGGELAVSPGSTSGSSVTDLAYDAASRTLNFSVGNWSNYTIFGLQNISVSTIANGTDNFTMRVTGTSNMIVNISSNRSTDKVNGATVPQNITLDSDGVATFNITNPSLAGYANISATNGSTTVYNDNVLFNNYSINFTNVSVLTNTTTAGINATYNLTLTNNGSLADTYTLTVSNSSSYSVTSLDTYLNISSVTLAAGTEQIISLDVSSHTAGIFYVNVTAVSDNESSQVSYINTTTNVTNSSYDISFDFDHGVYDNISTTASTNATYILFLENNGTLNDTYTLTVSNSSSYSVTSLDTYLNISSVTLAAGTEQIISLDVSSHTAGIFYVNVTAVSDNDSTKVSYINTTTNVTNSSYSIDFDFEHGFYDNISISAGTNATYTLFLSNNGTLTDTYTLTVTNTSSADVAYTNISSVTLASNAERIILLNVTNNTAGTFYVNVTAVSDNDSTKVSYINTTTTVTGSVYGVNFTNISALSASTSAGTNTTYTFNLNNNGTLNDTYTLSVINSSSADVAYANLSTVILDINANRTILLNVTNNTAGTYYVNITAISNNDSSKVSYFNTTTTVTGSVYGVNFTNISALSASTSAGTNTTYTFNLNNNGTLNDTYTLSVINSSSADVAYANLSTVILDINANRTILLNVTNNDAGTFYVNITAVSNNDSSQVSYFNTTTTVTGYAYGVNFTNVSALANTTSAGTNLTYTFNLNNNGTFNDTYTLSVINSSSYAITTLNTNINISSVTLDSDANRTILLNVSSNSSGIFYVNITAVSDNDSSKVSYFNTTTTVTGSLYGVNFTNVSALASTTTTGTNSTYTLYLNNNGTLTDTYTLSVTNSSSADVAYVNISSVTLVSNANRTILLNVTDNTAGTYYVNVTATSNNDSTKVSYFNTTTTVTRAIGSANGTLTDARFTDTLSGVLVTLTNATGGTYTNTTDHDGYYIISNITTSANSYIYTITASKTGYITNASATVTVLNSTSNSTQNVTLSAYNGTLTGAYIKSGTSIGISGATVNITNATLGSIIKTTATDGTYSVSLYPAIYTVNVTKTGYSNDSTSATVVSNSTTTVSTRSLTINTVTVTANKTVGFAGTGQNVSFNLTVVNSGDNATFTVTNTTTNTSTNVTTTTSPSSFLLNTISTTGYVVVEVNNSYFGGWPVTITIANSSQSKSVSITLDSIMQDSSATFTNVSSSNDSTTTVVDATLVNATITDNASVSGNSTIIMNATITGSDSIITDGAVIKGDYADSYITNSVVGNSTVQSTNLTSSTLSGNASVTNSSLTSATVSNSTLTNVTITSSSTITNVANLTNITIRGVDVTGVAAYDYEGELQGSATAGSVEYQGINFSKVYTDVRISQLVIEKSPQQSLTSGSNISINDTSLGTSMNFSMTVNLSSGASINISETGISPDGTDSTATGTRLGNFLHILSNDSNASNVTSHTLRLYFDIAPSTYSGGVAIYYYNTSTSAWEVQTTTGSGTDAGRYYREAIPNHFSTFALIGTTTTTTTATTGGSGGSGSAGVTTSEPFDNIEKAERHEKTLFADKPVTYTFTASEHGVSEIVITGEANEYDIALRVEALKGTSKLVSVSAPGAVYKNLNVWAGTKRIKEALIRFKVENSWLGSNNIASDKVKMVRWDGSQWVQLDTTQSTKDNSYTYYEAKTGGFSVFAIVGLKEGEVVPTEAETTPTSVTTPAGEMTPAPEATEEKKGFLPGFEVLAAILAVTGALYLRNKERR